MNKGVRLKVGIDLAPALFPAPGTARHVTEQARALFALDVPWEWVPLVQSSANPLAAEFAHLRPVVVPGRSIWRRATFSVGPAWQRAGCALGFATAYFVPWTGIPVVANFFDSNTFEFPQTWIDSGRRWNYLLIHGLSHYALRRSRKLFVNSQYCIDVLRRHVPGVADKLVLAPPGITPPRPAPATPPPSAPGRPYILHVGVFSENKNQRRLIEAWALLQARHPDFPSLVLVGACADDYRAAKIEPVLARLPRRHEVLLAGKVPDEELAWWYRNALAYVQPSFAEGFGLPVAEAMSYGLPVACSNTTSLPEVAGDAAVLFDPAKVAQLAQTMETLAWDAGLRSGLVERGAKRWERFSWTANAALIARELERELARA